MKLSTMFVYCFLLSSAITGKLCGLLAGTVKFYETLNLDCCVEQGFGLSVKLWGSALLEIMEYRHA